MKSFKVTLDYVTICLLCRIYDASVKWYFHDTDSLSVKYQVVPQAKKLIVTYPTIWILNVHVKLSCWRSGKNETNDTEDWTQLFKL